MNRDDVPFSYQTRKARPAVDPAMRRMVVGAAVVSMVVIGVALAWSGIRPGAAFGPPIEIAAPPGPLRIVPVDPGGLTVPGANEQIMSGATSNAAPQLAPDGQGPAIAQLSQAAGILAPVVVPPPLMAAPAVPTGASQGDVQVQLAATVDEAGVKTEWSKLEVKMPAVLAAQKPIFVPAVVDGQHIFRLRVGGFADVAAAKAFCATVIAKGGPCTVAAF